MNDKNNKINTLISNISTQELFVPVISAGTTQKSFKIDSTNANSLTDNEKKALIKYIKIIETIPFILVCENDVLEKPKYEDLNNADWDNLFCFPKDEFLRNMNIDLFEELVHTIFEKADINVTTVSTKIQEYMGLYE